jgi:ceramide glucosyltransferase
VILLLAAGLVYYLAALYAALRFRGPRPTAPASTPPVSLLKPVSGCDREFYSCIRSFAAQDYPEFELLFAVRDPADPAIPEIRRLAAEFPDRRIEVFLTDRDYGPNAKVNGMEALRGKARHEILLVSDADIRVEPGYLQRVVAPLADPAVTMVTCPYRGAPAAGLGSILEALWISTDFQPSVLVARLLGIEAALGATMVFRRADLDRIGGFAPLAAYLADDYQLGHALAGRIVLSDCPVETVLSDSSWAAAWSHRLRWGRTLRVCRPAGYAGVLITFAIPLALLTWAMAPQWWLVALTCVALRFLVAWLVASRILRDAAFARYWPLLPVSDGVSFAIWLASLFGRTVVWRGTRFRLRSDGRLEAS